MTHTSRVSLYRYFNRETSLYSVPFTMCDVCAANEWHEEHLWLEKLDGHSPLACSRCIPAS